MYASRPDRSEHKADKLSNAGTNHAFCSSWIISVSAETRISCLRRTLTPNTPTGSEVPVVCHTVLSPSLLSSLLLSLGGRKILEEKVGEMPPTPSVSWVKIVTSSPINSVNLPIHSLSCFQVPVESYLSLSFVPCMESRPKFVKYNVGITLSIDYSWEKEFLLYFQYQGIM